MAVNFRGISLESLQPLEEASDQLRLVEEELQEQKYCQMMEASFEIGKIVGALLAQKMALESGNRKLEANLEQLTRNHSLELKTLFDTWKTKSLLIHEKLGEVSRLFNNYTSRSKQAPCGTFSLANHCQSLQNLIDSIPKIHDQEPREYPQYPEVPAQQAPSPIVSYPYPVVAEQIHPIVQKFVKQREPEIQSLEKEVKSLEILNSELFQKKEIMKASHDQILEKFSKELEDKITPKKIMETARSIFSKIDWQFSGGSSCPNCPYPSSDYSPFSRQFLHGNTQDENIKKLQQLHVKVTATLDYLEELIDPEVKKG
ncbi:MAG: hypothetical protein K2X08_03180 [Chlamydiales bacterium]|nr:hypothetical protein [Chlamydiales bacterium]